MIARQLVLAGLVLAGSGRLLAQEPADEQIRLHDRVVFENLSGGVESVRCRIVEQTPDGLDIVKINDDGSDGVRFTLRSGAIREVIRQNSPAQVYENKRKKLPGLNADPAVRARALFSLARWCRTPHPALRGRPPMAADTPPTPEQAFGHLIHAARLDPSLVEVYPHLIDYVSRAESGQISLDQEVEIYLLAEEGGYQDPEILTRMGEICLDNGLRTKAEEKFRQVLDQPVVKNQSVWRRSRRHLTDILLATGRVQEALALHDPPADPALAGPEAFDEYYLSARIIMSQREPALLERAREYLESARKIQPSFPGVEVQLAALDLLAGNEKGAANRLSRIYSTASGDAGYLVALALVYLQQGKFDRAGERLDMAEAILGGGESAGPRGREVRAQLELARGLLLDYRGEPGPALGRYRSAWDSAPPRPTSSTRLIAGLLISRTQVASGTAAAARPILEEVVNGALDDPGVFEAYSRARASVEVAEGRSETALRLLHHAIGVDGKDAYLRYRHGALLLREGELEAAYPHLTTALELAPDMPEIHAALGYFHYSRGDLRKAEAFFRQLLKLVPKSQASRSGEEGARSLQLRDYALRGLEQVLDATRLEIWEDDFNRDDASEILRGWSEIENHGIGVAIRDGRLVFSGTQRGRADGVTKVFREEPLKNIERISARIRFPQGADSAVRAGLRIETTQDDAGAGIVLARDFDGRLGISTKGVRGDWKDVEPATGEKVEKGKLLYPRVIEWPDDGEFHTLSIRQADEEAGGKGFDVFIDGEPIARNVVVDGLGGKSTKPLLVGVSGQGKALGNSYEFEVEDFRIYRPRPGAEAASARGPR